jgi:1-phosphatidylinositol-3-phosphate 5-kinase
MSDSLKDVNTLTSFDLHPPPEKDTSTAFSKFLKKVKFTLLPSSSSKLVSRLETSSSLASFDSATQPETIKLIERSPFSPVGHSPSTSTFQPLPIAVVPPTEHSEAEHTEADRHAHIVESPMASSPSTSLLTMNSDKRSSINSLSSLTSHHKRTASILSLIGKLKGDDYSRDYWMQDDNCKECYDCKVPFSTFRRKHHCRACGKDIFLIISFFLFLQDENRSNILLQMCFETDSWRIVQLYGILACLQLLSRRTL